MISTRFTQHSLVTEVHKTIRPYLSENSISIDATMGNGHDTLFLAKHSLKVYAFDIQQEAIIATRTRLEKNNAIKNVHLIHAGHETMQQHIHTGEKADVILFNLGYLPHADTAIITQEKNTINALNHALKLLSSTGIISIIAYPGHEGGMSELQAVINWYKQLNNTQFAISIIRSMQEKVNSPRLFTIQRAQ